MLQTVSELKALNIDMELDEFHDFIADVFANRSHGTYSVEDMLCRWEEARDFAYVVQATLKQHFTESRECSSYIILKTILNMRKAGKISMELTRTKSKPSKNGRKRQRPK